VSPRTRNYFQQRSAQADYGGIEKKRGIVILHADM